MTTTNPATTVCESPELQAPGSGGKRKFWMLRVLQDGPNYFLQSESWREGGSHRFSTPSQIKPQNIGKSNETTPHSQAIFEFNAKIKKQHDQKGYLEDGEVSTKRPTQMTANVYVGPNGDKYNPEKKPTKAAFPYRCQPKMDGVRAFAHKDMGIWSRYDNDFMTDKGGFSDAHRATIMVDTGKIILDGELILNADYGNFQDTTSAVRKHDPDMTPGLELHVYDCFDPDRPNLTFDERFCVLEGLVKNLKSQGFPCNLVLVETITVMNHQQVTDAHDRWVAKGYEGAMLRKPKGKYKHGRSSDLLKVKAFQDAEFECTGWEDAVGSAAGIGKAVCKTKDGVEFSAPMNGTEAQRRKFFKDRDKIKGKMISVKFLNYTDAGSVRHPNGLAVRDYE